MLLPVIDSTVADCALRFDPQLVVIGACPALSFPVEFGVAAVGAALELIENRVREDLPVHDGLHFAGRRQAGSRRCIIGHGRSLRGRIGGEGGERDREGEDLKGAHATCTSRNMPVSM